MNPNKPDFNQSAARTFEIEAQSILGLINQLDDSFNQACTCILACQGRVIVTGMGKSGHIARKIAATLASTGTPAFFVHPGEASHGDMGMITSGDVVLALSNSGNTSEVITLLPLIKRLGAPLISLTGAVQSTLAQEASIHLNVSVDSEACPLNLAPTSSTTAALVMGDALAIALLEARGFTAEDFAFSHPGGALGRKLLLKTQDIMHSGTQIPRVGQRTLLSEALMEITSKGLGMTTIMDDETLLGVFTDGDLRRVLEKNLDIHSTAIGDCISQRACKTISSNLLAAEALAIMEAAAITTLVVVDNNKKLDGGQEQVVGIIHLHDILKAGVA